MLVKTYSLSIIGAALPNKPSKWTGAQAGIVPGKERVGSLASRGPRPGGFAARPSVQRVPPPRTLCHSALGPAAQSFRCEAPSLGLSREREDVFLPLQTCFFGHSRPCPAGPGVREGPTRTFPPGPARPLARVWPGPLTLGIAPPGSPAAGGGALCFGPAARLGALPAPGPLQGPSPSTVSPPLPLGRAPRAGLRSHWPVCVPG